MTARLIIDSLFGGREFTFETAIEVDGVETEVAVTYEGERLDGEDRKVQGRVGDVKVISVRPLEGKSEVPYADLSPEVRELLDTEAAEHFSEHNTDHDDDNLETSLRDYLDP